MEWFSGGVLNAITTCRQKQALFVVYIYDETSASQSTSEAWNSDEVVDVLKQNNFVALRVSKDTTEFNQFSQFFAVFIFPSIYCIDLSGKPLVVLNGQQTSENLKAKLIEAFGKLDEQSVSTAGSSCEASQNVPVAESTSEPMETTFSPTASFTSASESMEQKKKRYEEKIKQRRQERAEADQQRAKDKEKEHRETGKNIAKFKEMQAEQQNKSWMAERQKQKEEAKLAREEVRAKLEQDRREREDRQRSAAALRQRNREEVATSAQGPSSSKHSGLSRIQLRLPTGSTRVVEVNCTDSLDVLRNKVSEVLDSSPDKFSLIRLYPRQELSSDLDSQSMSELKLVPTGVIIVKMEKISGTGRDNILMATLMGAINFIIWILSITKNFIVNLFSSRTASHNESSANRHYKYQSDDKRVRKFRQEDFNDDNSEDESGTYNGNSTQQQ